MIVFSPPINQVAILNIAGDENDGRVIIKKIVLNIDKYNI
jgi:hypothetical protein